MNKFIFSTITQHKNLKYPGWNLGWAEKNLVLRVNLFKLPKADTALKLKISYIMSFYIVCTYAHTCTIYIHRYIYIYIYVCVYVYICIDTNAVNIIYSHS